MEKENTSLNDSLPSNVSDPEFVDIDDTVCPSMTKQKCDQEVLSYVLGSIVRRKVTCINCRDELMGTAADKTSFISFKEIEGCNLVTPHPEFVLSLKNIEQFMFENLKQIGHLPGINKIFSSQVIQRELMTFNFLKCECKCNSKEILTKEITNFFIRLFCKRKNENFEKEKHKNVQKIKKWKR